jgi:hypothetical protein
MNMAARIPAPAFIPDAGGFAEAPSGFHHDRPAAAENAPAMPPIDADLMRSDAIRRLLGSDSSQASPFVADADVFRRRHHAYLETKAAAEDPDAPDSDEEHQRRDAAFDLAEAVLVATPARHPHQIWVKFSVFEAVLEDFMRYGEQSAPRLLLALASLKHDLIALNIGDARPIFMGDL